MESEVFLNSYVIAIINKVVNLFKSMFDHPPEILVASPGRINLIGEHTDYNEGYVLPSAVDRYIIFAMSKRNGSISKLFSIDYNESEEVDFKNISKSHKNWANYLIGVIDQMNKMNIHPGAVSCAFSGNIPIASGLSSSAALECGFAFGLNELFELSLDLKTLAKLCQQSENSFVGVKCGIMDQFANLFSKKNYVMKLDTRSLEYEYYPIKLDEYKIVLIDTKIKRHLYSSEYNIRREQCELAVKIIQKYENIRALRDVTEEMLENYKNELLKNDPFGNSIIYKRAKFVIQENKRVLMACEFLNNNNLHALGELMFESHFGLRDLYEVSRPELDLLVDIAYKHPAVLGARVMGAGFGGCTINLVYEEGINDFLTEAKKEYCKIINKEFDAYIVDTTSGTSAIEKF